MTFVDRRFRLASAAGGMGLNCAADGLSLAGAPLLRKTAAGWSPRPVGEIEALMAAAYGRDIEVAGLMTRLAIVAEALNLGDVGRAMVATLQLQLPEPSWNGAARLARVHDSLAKYDPNEPRDWRGRWTTGSGAGPDASSFPTCICEARVRAG